MTNDLLLSSAPPTEVAFGLARRIVESHLRVVGRPLLAAAPEDDTGLAEALWTAPIAVVAHDTQADPVFCYGNRLALELFEMDYAAFTALPSRYSAEPLAREERAALLDRVGRFGFIDDYAGTRVSSTGRRFHIRKATVWNLIDDDGVYLGQAATFSDWEPL
ncbi:MAG: MEKHLA domain-containing protein [Betaproteobacteria bacterium]|nr:MEKHLA domain-containing protein [Betaproteobacteria bacterium]